MFGSDTGWGNLRRYHFWPKENSMSNCVNFPFFPYTDRRTLYHVSQSCRWPAAASGMWHAARGVHKLKCGRVSWESKWGKSKAADRRPHSGGSVLAILRAWPAWPAKKKERRPTKSILNKRPEASDFFLHLQFWMMANFVFDFCALLDAVCSWQIFSLSDFWQRVLLACGASFTLALGAS